MGSNRHGEGGAVGKYTGKIIYSKIQLTILGRIFGNFSERFYLSPIIKI